MILKYVLDSSVVIKWFSEYNEDDLDQALALRDKIAEGTCSIIISDLLIYEIANALRSNPHFTANDVEKAINAILDMDFSMQGINQHVMNRAIEIGSKKNVTVYDAYFLALAQLEKIPLVTADYKFIKRVKDHGHILRLTELNFS